MAEGGFDEASRGTGWRRFWAGVFLAAGGLALSVAADQLQEGLDLLLDPPTAPAAACVEIWCPAVVWAASGPGKLIGALLFSGLFVFFGYLVVQRRDAFLRSRARITRDQEARPLPVVVTTLSPLAELREDPLPADSPLARAEAALAGLPPAGGDETAPDEAAEAARRERLAALCDPAGPFARWPWQQPLRMLAHHRERLRCVVVILSPEAKPQFERFAALARALMRPGCRILDAGDPVALRDYNAVEDKVWWAIAKGAEAAGVPPREVCVDITGGTKVYSAVATVVTLNGPCVFGYVETFGPEVGKVLLYDAKIRGR